MGTVCHFARLLHEVGLRGRLKLRAVFAPASPGRSIRRAGPGHFEALPILEDRVVMWPARFILRRTIARPRDSLEVRFEIATPRASAYEEWKWLQGLMAVEKV